MGADGKLADLPLRNRVQNSDGMFLEMRGFGLGMILPSMILYGFETQFSVNRMGFMAARSSSHVWDTVEAICRKRKAPRLLSPGADAL